MVSRSTCRLVAVGIVLGATVFADGPLASADTALIVPGTAPSPYGPLRALYHFRPEMQPQIDANYYSPDATRRVIPYPGSFWPVTGLDSPTVNSSVDTGTNNLDAAIRGTEGPIAVAGLSQGTLALDREQARLARDPSAPPPDRLTFIKAGDPNAVLAKAFGPGTHVPVIDYTVPGPVESQYRTVNIVGQYDPFSDPPDHPGNLLADLNAIFAAGYYGHSATAFSDPSRVAPADIRRTTNAMGGTTTTYFIRSDELPLARALADLAGLPPQAVGRIDAALRPLIDRAYDPGPPHDPAQLVTGVAHIPAVSSPVASPAGPVSVGALAPRAVKGKGLVPTLRRLLFNGR